MMPIHGPAWRPVRRYACPSPGCSRTLVAQVRPECPDHHVFMTVRQEDS